MGALTAVSLRDELRRNPGTGVGITRPVEPTIEGRPLHSPVMIGTGTRPA